MHKVSIKPQWTIGRANGQVFSPRLVELLVEVLERGSLSSACKASGASYRHAWDLVRQGEALFGAPLLRMERGKGSSLTPLGEKLVWADRRIAARLSPLLDSLASELELEIGKVISALGPVLRLHASHGFAIGKLHEFLGQGPEVVELKYCSSQEAVAGLQSGACDVAGFHVPLGEFQPRVVAHYAQWLDSRLHRLVHVATRRQGLIVAAGNPRKIYDVADLARPGLRFINRQRGSGTRFLLDLLLAQAGVAPRQIAGYEQSEYTHAAVAAFVASDMADAAFGVETPARQFKLDFIPVAHERYFLLCDTRSLDTPPLQRMLQVLRSPEYHDAVDTLPGYDAAQAGSVSTLAEAFGEPGAAAEGRPGGVPRRGPKRAGPAT
jgi:molybdate transport repressor ModE-like protein